jgi:hypothetical protein
MRYAILIFMLCGCGGKIEVETKPAEFTVTVQEQILTKQDESLVILRENTTALAAIKSLSDKQNELNAEIVSLLKQNEASLSSADLNRKDGDPAATEPQEAAKANQSQLHQPVASPPAVRLFVTHAPFACPPCERLKTDVANGEFEGFEVTDSGDFAGLRSYPAIRFETPKTTTGWGVVYGYDQNTIPTLRALTGGTSAPATGAIFPVQTANTVTSSRTNFRSVSFWKGHNRGSRVTTRTTFRSGTSP